LFFKTWGQGNRPDHSQLFKIKLTVHRAKQDRENDAELDEVVQKRLHKLAGSRQIPGCCGFEGYGNGRLLPAKGAIKDTDCSQQNCLKAPAVLSQIISSVPDFTAAPPGLPMWHALLAPTPSTELGVHGYTTTILFALTITILQLRPSKFDTTFSQAEVRAYQTDGGVGTSPQKANADANKISSN
jgi:hypothetical protein